MSFPNTRVIRRFVALGVLLVACSPARRAPTGEDGEMPDKSDAGHVVNNPCDTSADCAAGVCDRATGRCVACRVTNECPDGQLCEAFVCRDVASCTGDLDCTSSGLVCDKAASHCVACNTSADCPDGPCVGHSCVESRACDSSLECTDLNMVCAPVRSPAWPESYAGKGCAECADAQDCDVGEACLEGLCVDVCAQQGRICGGVAGATCGECAAGGVCTPDGRSCLNFLPADYYADYMLAHDGTVFVWRDGRGGSAIIWRIDLDGTGAAKVAYSGGSGFIDGVAIAGGKVFAARTDGSLLSGTLDGKLTKFANVPGTDVSDSVWCQSLAGNDTHVVCALVDYKAQIPSGLYRIPVDGSAPTLFENTVTQPSGMLALGDEVVWSDFNGKRVGKTGLLTGKRTVFEKVQAHLLAIAGGYAFYETMDDTLRRALLSDGLADAVTDSTKQRNWRLLGATETRLYFADLTAETITLIETDLDGGAPNTVGEMPTFGDQRLLGVHEHAGNLYVILGSGVVRVDR